jgi:uncharacterized protein HemX
MPDNSSDPTAPESQRSRGPSTSSTVMIVVIAGACFLMLGACVLCGGGLAFPLLLRNQQQRAVDDAERAAVEAQRGAVEAQRAAEEQLRSAEETLRKGQETMRKLEDEGISQDRDAPPDDGDHSRGRAEPE